MQTIEYMRSADIAEQPELAHSSRNISPGVFLALTQTKLLIASRLVNALITSPGELGGILGARLVGEAFKQVAKAVDEAIDGEVNAAWTEASAMYAEVYRNAFVRSVRDRRRTRGRGH